MSDLERALRHAAVLTFEQLAFALPLDGAAEPAGPTAAREVGFAGPFGGRVVVTVERAMLPVLAANMLGVDEPPPPAEQEDALGEVTNVLAGHLLPAIAGVEHVFTLTAPRPVGQGGAPSARACVALDLGRVAVDYYREGAS